MLLSTITIEFGSDSTVLFHSSFSTHPYISVMTQIQTLNLPSEIISEIFKNFSTPVMPIHQWPKSFPWFLGHICARWRIIFLSMSTHFWGNIKINISKTMKPYPLSVAWFERALDILNFCLKCNEGCPLSFSFNMSALHCTEEYVYVIGILNALLAQSMRWVEVELCVCQLQKSRDYIASRGACRSSGPLSSRRWKKLTIGKILTCPPIPDWHIL